MIKYIFFLSTFLFISYQANAQLVNIESKRMQLDSIRFALKGELFFNYTNNKGDYLFQIGSGISTQLKSKDYKKIYFFIGNYNLVRSENQDFQNSWFFHFRYNQKLSNFFRLEGFLQNQNNELLTINSRNLIGLGIRLKLFSKENIKVYFGNSYMYEKERIKSLDNTFYNHRNSSYLSLSFNLAKSNLELTSTTYFQPLYEEISNHRILHQLKSEFKLSKAISFSALFDYFYNSLEINDIRDYSSRLYLGLTFNY